MNGTKLGHSSHGKKYGETANPDEAFKSNGNLKTTGGVAPTMVQKGHSNDAQGNNRPGSARGHSS